MLISCAGLGGGKYIDVAGDLINQGSLSQAQGKCADAELRFQLALTILETARKSDHPKMVLGLDNLGRLHVVQDKDAKVDPLDQDALTISETAWVPPNQRPGI